jgi:hypothetical protein
MAWPVKADDLQAIVDVVRAGRWLRPGRPSHGATYFIAGYVAARPEATIDEIGSALRLAGLGPLAWQQARGALTAPRPLRARVSQWMQRGRA